MPDSGSASNIGASIVGASSKTLGSLVCFSHIRWDADGRRLQQLMGRFAARQPVIVWEEPVRSTDGRAPHLEVRAIDASDLLVVTPVIAEGLSADEAVEVVSQLLSGFLAGHPTPSCLWYNTPSLLPISARLDAACVVYDSMDDLADPPSATTDLPLLEDSLIERADLVFTGTVSHHEVTRTRHPATHVFASIDRREKSLSSAEVDARLADRVDTISWDRTQHGMAQLIDDVVANAGDAQRIVSPTSMKAGSHAHDYDVMIVGAGFAGAVMAERLAADAGKRVLVVDRRPHVGGNAFDCLDEAGILIHRYGPHIFHTNSDEIVAYLSRFTDWRPYEHRVLADVDGMLVPMPINRTTLNALYGCNLANEAEAAAFLAARAEPVSVVRTSADVVISAVGRELYETFFQGYTRKQWGMDPSQLDKSVTARVPTRTNTDDRYFTDSFQAMPAAGFTAMFERMLDHPNIDLLLGVDYADIEKAYPHEHLVFTGPIDEYFGHCYGKLPYRSLRFVHETRDIEQIQPVAVVNYPSEDVPYTRVTEYKHLTGQVASQSSITYEYPSLEGDPYYPIPRAENQALFKRYDALARAQEHMTFVGRLATYRYYNMDQVVGQALATYRRVFGTAKAASTGLARAETGIAA